MNSTLTSSMSFKFILLVLFLGNSNFFFLFNSFPTAGNNLDQTAVSKLSTDVLNFTTTFLYPETQREVPLTIFYPNILVNESLPLLMFASGFLSRPGESPINTGYQDYINPLVRNGYVIGFPHYSMAYYEATQKGGAELIIQIKDYILASWEYQNVSNVVITENNTGYIGYSDGGGIAVIAGKLDNKTKGIIGIAPSLTMNQLNIELTNFQPHLLALGGTLDPSATADKLEFLSDLLDYNEKQIYVVFKNCNHYAYWFDPYYDLTVSLSIVFCEYVFKNNGDDYSTFFGEDLYSTDLAQEMRIVDTSSILSIRSILVFSLLFSITIGGVYRYRSNSKKNRLYEKIARNHREKRMNSLKEKRY
ncbi:MAG: hypothetical protein ACXABI_01575 [Candidatus Hodarchaeales archaeon]